MAALAVTVIWYNFAINTIPDSPGWNLTDLLGSRPEKPGSIPTLQHHVKLLAVVDR